MTTETEAPTTEQEAPTTERSLSLLAQERFGTRYHAVEREEAAPADAAPEVTEEEESPDPVDETTEESEVEETESAQPEQVEYEEYQLPHIAQLLGVDESQLDVTDEGRIVLRGKVDGQPVNAPVKEILENYQKFTAADKRLEDAKTRAQTQNQEWAQKSEELQAQFVTAASLIEKAEKLLDQDSKSINWDDLRKNDPAEYSAKKTELSERKQDVERIRQEAAQEYVQSQQKQASEFQKQYQQYIQGEQTQLLTKIPEWKDEEKANAEKNKLTEFLLKNGFTKDDVMQASDHRLIVLARKAWLYEQSQKDVDTAKKKVAKVPKVMKPGAPKSPDQTTREHIKRLEARLRQTGSKDDAFALLQARKRK